MTAGTDLTIIDFSAETQIGSITTNAKAVLESVRRGVEKYKAPDYEPDEKTAKSDKAALNKAAKLVDEERKRVERAYNAPLEELKQVCREIKSELENASTIADEKYTFFCQAQKEKKRKIIVHYFESLKFDVLPLERLFDPRWLNKTVKMEDITAELDAKINRVYEDLKTIEGMSEHAVIAKSKYLDTLDMGLALAEVSRLKENAERLAKEKAERAVREDAKAEAEVLERESVDLSKREVIDVSSMLEVQRKEQKPSEDIYSFTFTFSATEQVCRALRRYMLDNGIEYKKIDMSLYELKANTF
ncbi:MAG: DUF1351 domain-containing protein [Spirochaetaceae bacterium]|jgi:hypothetical protein|nr:DUF1351 domain-containing protein [Spirochaetaceae bacterium]